LTLVKRKKKKKVGYFVTRALPVVGFKGRAKKKGGGKKRVETSTFALVQCPLNVVIAEREEKGKKKTPNPVQ